MCAHTNLKGYFRILTDVDMKILPHESPPCDADITLTVYVKPKIKVLITSQKAEESSFL